MANTGYKQYNTLLRVVDGGPYDGEPLDINGELTSISGLPQATKSNIDTDPDYIEPILDYTECPLPPVTKTLTVVLEESDDIDIQINDVYNDNVLVLDENITVEDTYDVIYLNNLGFASLTITNNSIVSIDYLLEDGLGYSVTGTLPSGDPPLLISSVPKNNLTLTVTNSA